MDQLPGFRFGFRVSGFGFQDSGCEFRLSGFWIRVSNFRFRFFSIEFRGSAAWKTKGVSYPELEIGTRISGIRYPELGGQVPGTQGLGTRNSDLGG